MKSSWSQESQRGAKTCPTGGSVETTLLNPRSLHTAQSHTIDTRRRIAKENSISIQQDQVRPWAEANGVEIIHEFTDPGRSGLTAEGRPGFQDMMENWVRQRSDFQYILCLDVSRWGRFQDIDLSAQYSAECRKYGKEVIYTTLGKPREDDPLYPVYVQFERFRAAQYSRELSDKVFRGCVKIAQQGYWAGGKPRYGFRRLLLNETRQPVQVLRPGERKSIQNQRVTLTLGEEHEVAVVRRIFHEFTAVGRHEHAIAEGLNHDRIPSPGGRVWDGAKVRDILVDERYTGTMVYNRTTQKLKTPSRPNPREKWICTPESFEQVIAPAVFAKAQEVFSETGEVSYPGLHAGEVGDCFFAPTALSARPCYVPPRICRLLRPTSNTSGQWMQHFSSYSVMYAQRPAVKLANSSRHWLIRLSSTMTSWSSMRSSRSLFSQPFQCPMGLRTIGSFVRTRETSLTLRSASLSPKARSREFSDIWLCRDSLSRTIGSGCSAHPTPVWKCTATTA